MKAVNPQPITVIGGTGFLGRRIVARLADGECRVRVAVRNPDRVRGIFSTAALRWIEAVRIDVRDEDLVASSLAESRAVVNAVAAYVERKGATFDDVHERGARNVAECARRLEVEALVHISGIGADPASPSRYVRSRGRGEQLVRQHFDGAVIVRPSVMFGSGDAFLNSLASAVRMTPVLPVFGGRTRLQPVHVADVAEAVCRILGRADARGRIFELGGPSIYSFRALIGLVASEAERRPLILPVPIGPARFAAWLLERLPKPPLTLGQVELLAHDNVVSHEAPGFGQLCIAPTALEPIRLSESARPPA